MSGHLNVLAALPPEKTLFYLWNRRLVGLESWFGYFGEDKSAL